MSTPRTETGGMLNCCRQLRDAPCPNQGRSERAKTILPNSLVLSSGMGAD
jgi:hypothetical protein